MTVRPFLDERGVVRVERNVVIFGWRDAPTANHILEWHRIGREVAKTYPRAGACVDVVLRGTPRFTDDMRRATEKLAADDNVFELGSVHVILLPGLAGTAVRAFIGTVLLVTRSKTPNKVVATIDEAVAWMAPRVAPTGWTRAALQTACEEVMGALEKG